MSTTPELTLYDYWLSSACYRVRIALNLKGLRHARKSVHLVKDGGEQHSAASVSEHQTRPCVLAVKYVLDGNRIGVVARQDFTDAFVDVAQSLGQRLIRVGADHAAFQK